MAATWSGRADLVCGATHRSTDAAARAAIPWPRTASIRRRHIEAGGNEAAAPVRISRRQRPGCRAAKRAAAIAPTEHPSTAAPSRPAASSTATRSSAGSSMLVTAADRADRPWPRRSGRITRNPALTSPSARMSLTRSVVPSEATSTTAGRSARAFVDRLDPGPCSQEARAACGRGRGRVAHDPTLAARPNSGQVMTVSVSGPPGQRAAIWGSRSLRASTPASGARFTTIQW